MPRIEVNGLAVHYEAPRGLGPAERTVLLVHGAAGSSRHWGPLMEALDAEFYPLAVDLPGHGATGGWVGDSVAGAADFLADCLEALDLPGAVVFGHSLGGLVAQQFTLAYPRRVEKLILAATAARVTLHPDFLAQARSGQWDFPLMRQSFAPEVPAERVALVLNDLARTRLDPARLDFMDTAECDLKPRLGAIKARTLVFVGGGDVIISPRKTVALARDIPTAQLVTLADAGHYLHIEKPTQVAGELARFLQPVSVNSL